MDAVTIYDTVKTTKRRKKEEASKKEILQTEKKRRTENVTAIEDEDDELFNLLDRRYGSLGEGAKHIIVNIIKKVELEKERNNLEIPLKSTLKRAIEYLKSDKISEQLIRKVLKDIQSKPISQFNINYTNLKPYQPDNFDMEIIRKTIRSFYTEKLTIPTLELLLASLKGKVNINRNKNDLMKILKQLGYKWLQSEDKTKCVLIERPDIVDKRCLFLTQMRSYRSVTRNIVYIDEIWIDKDLKLQKYTDIKTNEENKDNKILVLIAGNCDGYIPNSCLVLKPDTYSMESVYEKFADWINSNIIPNVAAKSVIVMSDVVYHCNKEDIVPTRCRTKMEMLAWLQSKGCPVDHSFRKTTLYELIENIKPQQVDYKIVKLLKYHEHDVLWQPKVISYLNPIQLICDKIIVYLKSRRNTNEDMDIEQTYQLVVRAVDSITISDWKKSCKYISELEAEYWNSDMFLEEVLDHLAGNLCEQSIQVPK